MRLFKAITIITFTILAGCATLISGESKTVALRVSPPEAVVEYDGREYRDGDQIRLRKQCFGDIRLRATCDGYREQDYIVTKRVDAVWGIGGNLCITYGFGILIDMATGALMDIDERNINIRLRRETQYAGERQGGGQ